MIFAKLNQSGTSSVNQARLNVRSNDADQRCGRNEMSQCEQKMALSSRYEEAPHKEVNAMTNSTNEMKTVEELREWWDENPQECERYFKSLPIDPQITYRVTPFASSSGRLAFHFIDEDAALTIQIKEEGGPGEINLVVDGYFAGLIHQLIAQQSNSFRKRSLRTS